MRTSPDSRPATKTFLKIALLLVAAGSCRFDRDAGETVPSGRPPELTERQSAVTVPAGFDGTTIVNDGPSVPSPIQGPTKMAMAPDGRIFVAEHWGGVRIIKNDVVLPTAFLRIPAASIDTVGSRGLMGIVLDPAFSTNGWVYLHYTRKISATVSRNRIGRYTASAGNLDVAVTDGSGAPVETLIYEMTNQGSANAHNSMPMVFGGDGKLWVTTGENNVPANAQNTTHTGGKLLRLNPDGSPAPGNPLFNSSNQVEKRLWAKGLRNPWSLARDPATNRIFFNDVGSLEGGTPDPNDQPWEEANSVPLTTTALLDYGWPNNEGLGSNLVHRYANGPGNDGADCGIVGAAFYRSSGQTYSFAPAYAGAFFFGDHCTGWIRYLPSTQQTPGSYSTNAASGFATNLGAALVDLQVHPDGSLYYIARATVVRDHDAPGIIGRIRPTAVAVPTVSITAPVDGDNYASPASLTITASATAGGGTLTKVEFFSNDVKLGEDTIAPYEQPMNALGQGLYRLTARATNSLGGSKLSDAVTVTVDGPTALIATPEPGETYVAGAPVSFSGSGSDPQDGTLPASALEWNVLLHHNSHTHPAAGPFVGVYEGQFTPNPDDETDHDVFYGVYLTVTDSAGLRHTARRDILPLKSTITLASAPSGLKVNLDSSPQTTPKSLLGVAGVNRTLEAPLCQTLNGTFYGYGSWSDGGGQSHVISTPSTNTTFTATFSSGPWLTADIGAVAAVGNYSAQGNTACSFTIAGSGADIYGTADEFRFVYRSVSGDATITARVASLANPNVWTKAALMMRDGTAAGARNVAALLSPTATNKFRRQVRTAANGTTASVSSTPNSQVPGWLRVSRTGNDFAASFSTDGVTFTPMGTPQTIAMPSSYLVGMAVTSHADGTLATGVFDNVTVTGAVLPTPPSAPTNLVANGGAGQATLGWTDNSNNETGFKLERKLAADPDTSYAEVAAPAANATSHVNGGLAAGTYDYRIRASNAAGNSSYAGPATAVVTAAAGPAAPSNLTALTSGPGAALSWTDNSSNETGFRVERKTGAGSYAGIANKSANVTTHTDGNLAAGTYTYRVIATGSPESAPSNELTLVITGPAADAYVRGGVNGNTNYGTAATVEVKWNASPADNNRNGYTRFSLAGVQPTVVAAKLRLYGNAATSAKSIGVYSVSITSWVESGTGSITWNNAPAMSTSALSAITVPTTAGFVEWDVTSYVAAQRAVGAATVSLGIKNTAQSPEGQSIFQSRESTTAANRPVLVVTSK